MILAPETEMSDIKYASVIQQSMLPKKRHFRRIFKDFMLIYKPHSGLSGDFYWIGEHNDNIYFAVGDCTGHGVSAAMLSMLGYSYLNYAILHKNLINTNDILKEIDKQLIETFSSINENTFDNDWIDMAVCRYNKPNNFLQISTANRKVLVINNDKDMCLVRGSRYPVGGWQLEKERHFEAQTLFLSGGSIYIGSDGFQDQIGGDEHKKFGSKKLHALIIEIQNEPMELQKETLEKELLKWKQDNSQTDDICLMGVKI